MRCDVIAVVAALSAVVAAGDPQAVALAPAPRANLADRRSTRRGEFPFVALVATMWGECTSAILAPIAVLGPSSCLPEGAPKNGRVEAGNNRFLSMKDFGQKPTQGKIIEKFIKQRNESPDANSLMIMKLLEPFYFTHYVHAIPIATEERRPPVRALVVGYGMGSEDWHRRQQTALELLLVHCRRRRRGAMCAARPAPGCRPDHGAVVVAGGKLLAVAGSESLCQGPVILVAPHRAWITKQLTEIGHDGKYFARYEGERSAKAGASTGSSLGTRWSAAVLLALVYALW